MEKVAILFKIFNSEKNNMLSLINIGYKDENGITYNTKNGKQTKKEDEFINEVEIININEIDFKDSLFYWFRRKENEKHLNKNIIYNEDLKDGQEYYVNGWACGLLINPSDNCINLKIINK